MNSKEEPKNQSRSLFESVQAGNMGKKLLPCSGGAQNSDPQAPSESRPSVSHDGKAESIKSGTKNKQPLKTHVKKDMIMKKFSPASKVSRINLQNYKIV